MDKKIILSALFVFALSTVTAAFSIVLIPNSQSKKGAFTPDGKYLIQERQGNVPWWKRFMVFKPLKVSEKERKEWQDSRGLGFWYVHNTGTIPVSVSTDIQKGAVVAPGEKMKIYRGKKFWVVFKATMVQHLPTGRKISREDKKRIKTKNHYIEVSTPYSGDRFKGERKRVLRVKSKA